MISIALKDAKRILSEAEFVPFTNMDWYAFAGCESKFPLICHDHEGYLIIQDGGSFTFYKTDTWDSLSEGDWKVFDITG